MPYAAWRAWEWACSLGLGLSMPHSNIDDMVSGCAGNAPPGRTVLVARRTSVSRSTRPSSITLIALRSLSRIAEASLSGGGVFVLLVLASAAAFCPLASASARISFAPSLILAIASS